MTLEGMFAENARLVRFQLATDRNKHVRHELHRLGTWGDGTSSADLAVYKPLLLEAHRICSVKTCEDDWDWVDSVRLRPSMTNMVSVLVEAACCTRLMLIALHEIENTGPLRLLGDTSIPECPPFFRRNQFYHYEKVQNCSKQTQVYRKWQFSTSGREVLPESNIFLKKCQIDVLKYRRY